MTGNRPLPTVPAGEHWPGQDSGWGGLALPRAPCEPHRAPPGWLLMAQAQASSSPGAAFSVTDPGGGWHAGRRLQGAQRKGGPH